MLLSKKKITEDLVDRMMGWRYSWFNVYCCHRIQLGDEDTIEDLAQYIIRAWSTQQYLPVQTEEKKSR